MSTGSWSTGSRWCARAGTSSVHRPGCSPVRWTRWKPDVMSAILVTGIGELVTCDDSTPDRLGVRDDAALVVDDGLIGWLGPASAAPPADTRIDVEGRGVIPGFVDSHSHLVFAGDRSAEFAARMAGAAYDGGGIGVSVTATRKAGDARLTDLVASRVAEMRRQGTTTVEIKSGYGLTVADEVQALRI